MTFAEEPPSCWFGAPSLAAAQVSCSSREGSRQKQYLHTDTNQHFRFLTIITWQLLKNYEVKLCLKSFAPYCRHCVLFLCCNVNKKAHSRWTVDERSSSRWNCICCHLCLICAHAVIIRGLPLMPLYRFQWAPAFSNQTFWKNILSFHWAWTLHSPSPGFGFKELLAPRVVQD